MLRILPLVLVVFMVPFVAHALFHWLREGEPFGAYLRKAPLLALGGIGAGLVLAVLVTYATFTGEKPGAVYRPPVLKDGRIEPGHFE